MDTPPVKPSDATPQRYIGLCHRFRSARVIDVVCHGLLNRRWSDMRPTKERCHDDRSDASAREGARVQGSPSEPDIHPRRRASRGGGPGDGQAVAALTRSGRPDTAPRAPARAAGGSRRQGGIGHILHAKVWVPPNDRVRLERCCCNLLRPPLGDDDCSVSACRSAPRLHSRRGVSYAGISPAPWP
jgi:hypothetical protein